MKKIMKRRLKNFFLSFDSNHRILKIPIVHAGFLRWLESSSSDPRIRIVVSMKEKLITNMYSNSEPGYNRIPASVTVPLSCGQLIVQLKLSGRKKWSAQVSLQVEEFFYEESH